MDTLNIDYETYCDLSLPDVGTRRYVSDPSFEVLMAAYSFNGSDNIQQWTPAEGEKIPAELAEALISPDVQKWAWNAPFEINVTDDNVCEVDTRQWRDTMVLALHLSLPGKLEKAGPVVGLDAEKLKDRRGGALMRKFSFPRKPSKKNPSTRTFWHEAPEDWEAYKEYNRQDVVAEMAIQRKLRKYIMPDDEWELWQLDQQINRRGLPINVRMVKNAIRLYEEALGSAKEGTGAFGEMAAITGLANPNSPAQLLPWLQEQGYPFDDLKKGHVERARSYFTAPPEHWGDNFLAMYQSNDELRRVLELRLETSRTSIKKYYALDKAHEDGQLCYTLQMNGAARTGRWGGRLFQPQNLPRPEKRFEPYQPEIAEAVEHFDLETMKLVHGNPFDVLASAIRPAAQAPDGMVFVDADLSAIENRVLGWIAGCDKILDVFRQNRDPYLSFATYLYDASYEDLWHEYKVLGKSAKRTIGKPGTLGCGYGMGPGGVFENEKTGELEATGLTGYAWGMGIRSFTPEDAKLSVDTFRSTFKEVTDFWYDLERAAKRCVRSGHDTEHGPIRFEMQRPFLKMILPSGRALYYLRPRLDNIKTPWGKMKVQLTYEGLNDKKQWIRTHTTPGKLTENADQAISRDLIANGLTLANREGLDIRLHVHDQIVALSPEERADDDLKLLMECMNEVPHWAKGLPLGSAGQITRVFMKD